MSTNQRCEINPQERNLNGYTSKLSDRAPAASLATGNIKKRVCIPELIKKEVNKDTISYQNEDNIKKC